MARHPLDRRAGAAEHRTGLSVQTLAHRHGEIVVDGVAHEVVTEGETITRLGEQPGIHRRGQRGTQLGRGPAGDQRQLGQRERRPQDRGDPQQVQGVLRQQAQPAQEGQPQGGWQRRRAGLGPSVPHVDRPLVVERPHQLDHEQRVSAGAPTCSSSRGPAGSPATSPARSAASSELNGPRPRARRPAPAGRRRPGRRRRHGIPAAPSRTPPTAGGSGGGRWSAAPQGQRVGPLQVLDGEGDRDRSTRVLPGGPRRPRRSAIPRPRPPLAGTTRSRRALADPQQAGQLGTRGIGCARSTSRASLRARRGRSRSSSSHAPEKTRNPAPGRTPALRRADGTCRSQPRPRRARSRARPVVASSMAARATSSSTARPTNRTRGC